VETEKGGGVHCHRVDSNPRLIKNWYSENSEEFPSRGEKESLFWERLGSGKTGGRMIDVKAVYANVGTQWGGVRVEKTHTPQGQNINMGQKRKREHGARKAKKPLRGEKN